MAEPFRPAVLDRDQDVQNYKPLALFAVAAFAVSALFTTIIVVLTVWGLITRKPFMEAWLIPVAFSGVLLSIAGRWQISLAEGTREGLRLTKIAWWLSLVGGAMYTAYYFGNLMAIQNQARRFVHEELLTKLKDKKIEEAFASTVKPNQRKGMNIGDIKARFGDVVAPFKLEPLPRMYQRADGVAEVEDVGVDHTDAKAEGLAVFTRFLVRTPEGAFDVGVPVIGVENPETGAREWFVERNQIRVKPLYISTYGGLLSSLQEEVDNFFTAWLHQKRFPGARAAFYYDTLPLSNEERRLRGSEFGFKSLWAMSLPDMTSIPMGGLGPVMMVLNIARFDDALSEFEPGIATLNERLIHWDESHKKLTADEKKSMLPKMLRMNVLQGSMQASSGVGKERTTMEVSPKRVRASIPLEVSLPEPINYRCTGRVYADCTDPEIVAELNKLKTKVADGSPDESLGLLKSLLHEWYISEIVIDPVQDMGDLRPPSGAGGGPGKVQFKYPSPGGK
jgi:hypothetical protein